MGCDIHLYLEHRPQGQTREFSGFPRINPGRDYGLFGRLADVRGGGCLVMPRGVPENLSYLTRGDYELYISEKSTGEKYCTPLDAARWVAQGCSKYVKDHEGKNTWVTHPDWHTHSWLTPTEFEAAMKACTYKPDVQYDALLAAAKSLEQNGHEVRFVFWFDN